MPADGWFRAWPKWREIHPKIPLEIIGTDAVFADTEAVAWLRRGLEVNRNYPLAHLHLASALALVGELDEARAAVQAGLALDPGFTVRRLRASNAWSGNPAFLAGRERQCEGLRLAGVPEG